MRRFGFLSWSLAGLAAGAFGWVLGGWIAGTLLGRTVGATTLVALAFGLLTKNVRAIVAVPLVTAAISVAVFDIGTEFVTPMLAFPTAALVLGIAAALLLRRSRSRIVAVATTPLFGMLGFAAGTVAIGFAGFGMDSGRVLEQLLVGGAAGFGLLALSWLRLLGPWLDRAPAVRGGAA
jgi:hypothetical protein